MAPSESQIRVLHVDDEPDFADLAATILEREDDRFSVETETSANAGLDRLSAEAFDCIVSDYEMPGENGIEFLKAVRETDPDLPFILYTGKGSEDIASEAISAGVTDYLQKGTGQSQYTVLANRIENAVGQFHAEQALEEAEHRYQRLIEESTDIITVVDESGTFKYVSPAAERVLGYPNDELLGDNGFDYIHPDDNWAASAKFSELATGATDRVTTEFRFRRPDGDYIWIEVKGRNLLDDPVIGGLVVSVRDISERKEREKALERDQNRFSTLFEELGEPVVEVTFDGEEAVIQNVNDAFERVFGITSGDAVGDPIDTHIVPQTEQESASELNRLVREGERVERELQRETAEGMRTFLFRSVPFTVNGESRAYAMYFDITERIQQEERFQAFLEHSMDTITVLDAEGRCTYQNPSIRRVLGYDPDELRGAVLFDFIHPEDRADVKSTFEATLSDPSQTPTMEYRVRHTDGSWRWVESVGNNQLDNPAIEGVVINTRDISTRKAYEEQL